MFDAGVTQLKEIAAVDPSSESLIARQSPALVTARYPRPLADQLFAFHGQAPGSPSELPAPPPIWGLFQEHWAAIRTIWCQFQGSNNLPITIVCLAQNYMLRCYFSLFINHYLTKSNNKLIFHRADCQVNLLFCPPEHFHLTSDKLWHLVARVRGHELWHPDISGQHVFTDQRFQLRLFFRYVWQIDLDLQE